MYMKYYVREKSGAQSRQSDARYANIATETV